MRKLYNSNLEALRGFCALIVVLHHALLFNKDLGNRFELPVGYGFPGHTLVLIFFILSGYVIGISYYGKSSFNSKQYIIKRLIRLYPIYVFAVVLTSLVYKDNLKIILGNLLFLQNVVTPVLSRNNALWSLNHEIVYYLLAIPILYYRIGLKYIISVLIVLLSISVSLYPFPAIVEGYLVGFLFWITGFQLSVYTRNGLFEMPKISTNEFLSVLFLLLASGGFSILPLDTLPTLHQPPKIDHDDLVSFADFSKYLFCLYAILFMVDRKWSKRVGVIIYGLTWLVALQEISGGQAFDNVFFYAPFLFLCISSFLFFYKKPLFKSIQPLYYLGGISYGMYVIHMPILHLIGKVNGFNNTWFSYCIRVSILLLTVVALAHFLEKIMQVKVKMLVDRIWPGVNSSKKRETALTE